MSGNYPSDVLPLPSQSGYSYTVEPIVKRERMDSGRYRQVSTDISQYIFVNLQWELTDAELNLWKGFYNAVTDFGALSFQINLAFGGGVIGSSAKFIPGYSVSAAGSFYWSVSAQLQLETIEEIDTQGELETAGASLGLVGTTWLTALPNIQSGFSFTVETATARTKSETSRYQNRNRINRNVHVASVEWLFTDAEMAYFKGWHRVILGFGVRKFAMDLAFGDGYQSNTARFVDGTFTAAYLGGDNWQVIAQLECDRATGEIQTFSEYLTAAIT